MLSLQQKLFKHIEPSQSRRSISSTTKSSWILFCTFYSLAEVRINVLMMIQLILVQSPHFDFNINIAMCITLIKGVAFHYSLYVLQAATTVKISQLEIFSIVNSLIYIMVKLVKVKQNFSDRTYNRKYMQCHYNFLVKFLTTVAARSTDCSGMPSPWLMYVSPGR